jgi:hypothetical protein
LADDHVYRVAITGLFEPEGPDYNHEWAFAVVVDFKPHTLNKNNFLKELSSLCERHHPTRVVFNGVDIVPGKDDVLQVAGNAPGTDESEAECALPPHFANS